MNTIITTINDSTWAFEEQGVRFFLLAGTETALLLDSGMMTQNVRELVRSVTDLPVILMNTHADRDHIAGNHEFAWFYMHPAEAANYYNTQHAAGTFRPIHDGQIIDLGDRELEVITIPGHTPGHVAVLDRRYRALYSGDPVQDGRIFMFGVQREMHAYRMSLLRLKERAGEFDAIYPCHGTCPVGTDMIVQLYEASGKIMEGSLPYTVEEVFGNRIRAYDTGCAVFLLDDPQS